MSFHSANDSQPAKQTDAQQPARRIQTTRSAAWFSQYASKAAAARFDDRRRPHRRNRKPATRRPEQQRDQPAMMKLLEGRASSADTAQAAAPTAWQRHQQRVFRPRDSPKRSLPPGLATAATAASHPTGRDSNKPQTALQAKTPRRTDHRQTPQLPLAGAKGCYIRHHPRRSSQQVTKKAATTADKMHRLDGRVAGCASVCVCSQRV